MNVFTMVVAVVAMGTAIVFRALKVREKELVAKAANSGADEGKLKELEERIRVLERIATDKSSRLKDEIDAL